MNDTRVLESALLVVAILATIAAAGVWFAKISEPGPAEATSTSSSGVDTLVVLLLSSNCDACTREPEYQAVKRKLAEIRSQPDRRIRTVGVSVERDPLKAQEFLVDMAVFDEMYAGGGWANWAVLDLVWSEETVPAGVPQMILLERVLEEHQDRIVMSSRTILEREYGLVPILAALEQLKEPGE